MAKLDGLPASQLAQSEQANVAHLLFTMDDLESRFFASERIRGEAGAARILRVGLLASS
jgi:hypothetical protein